MSCTCSTCVRARFDGLRRWSRIALAWAVIFSTLALYAWALGRGFRKW